MKIKVKRRRGYTLVYRERKKAFKCFNPDTVPLYVAVLKIEEAKKRCR